MQETCWTSHATEKQHASSSIMRKYHPEASDLYLTRRAFLHTFKQVIHGSVGEGSYHQRLLQKKSRLFRGSPNPTSGRHVFCKETIQKAMIANKYTRGTKRPYTSKNVVKLHGEFWRKLPEARRNEYERKASSLRSEKQHVQQQALEEVQSSLNILSTQRECVHQDSGGSMQYAAAAVPREQLAQLPGLLRDSKASSSGQGQSGPGACPCPTPLTEAVMSQYRDLAAIGRSLPDSHSSLYHDVAICWLAFKHAIFGVPAEMDYVWYKFLFATLRPIKVSLMSFEAVSLPQHHGQAGLVGTWHQDAALDFTASWDTNVEDTQCYDIFEDTSAEQCLAFMHSKFTSHALLTTLEYPQPLSVVLKAALADVGGSGRAGTARGDTGQHDSKTKPSQTLPPWVGEVLSGSSSSCTGPGAPASTDPSAHDLFHQHSEESVDEVETAAPAFEDLESRRAAWADAMTEASEWCKVALIGGSWSVSRSGRQVYGFRADVKKGTPAHRSVCIFTWSGQLRLTTTCTGSQLGQHLYVCGCIG